MKNRIIDNLSNLNKVFVHEADKNYSYQDLYEVVRRLNSFFEINHVDKVLVSLPQGFMAYAAIISCYISNVTFCSIHFEDPLSRKELYCSEFMPDMIITNQIEDFASDKFWLISEKDIMNMCLDEGKEITIDNDNEIAYVIYTSGSTGLPKDV